MNQEQLLSLLEKNSRYDTKDLADVLNETEEHILEAMSEMERQKIICGYHTVINWDKTNTDKVMALIEIGATPEREYGYDRIARNIYRYPEVDSMYLMSGTSEFMVIIYGKTMQEISEFVAMKLACVEYVISTATFFVLKQYKADGEILEEAEVKEERLIVTP